MEAIAEGLDAIAARRPAQARSLLVTLLGDAVLPHGGAVWIGALARLAAPFGISERAVRTAAFRLTQEGWLVPRRVGRRSDYIVTEAARRRSAAADRAIYGRGRPAWDGGWTVVFTGQAEAPAREALEADLRWQGFGRLQPGVMVHPAPEPEALRQALSDAGGAALSGRLAPDGANPRELAARAWDLAALGAGYEAFLADYRPFLDRVARGAPAPATCFRLRTLLVHDYRRALLRDPLLPEELLPPRWPGLAARELCRELYCAVQQGAERHLAAVLETAEGPAPAAEPGYFARFGGLTRGD